MLGATAALLTCMLSARASSDAVRALPCTQRSPAVDTPASAPAPMATGTVVFVGDVVPHGAVIASSETRGQQALLGPIAPVLRAADVALVNLESPVSPSLPTRRSGPPFNVGRTFARALANAGIDGVTIANNHAYDAGSAGIGETIVTLRRMGLVPIGGALRGHDPLVPAEFSVAGRTLCVFAVTRLINYGPEPGEIPPARVAIARPGHPHEERAVLEALRAGRARCDAMLVAVHAGREFADRPEPDDARFFRALVAEGADAVIGTHSHTVQPVETYEFGDRRAAIFNSLGNAVSNQATRADEALDPWEGGRWLRSRDARLREGLLAVLRFEAMPGGGLRLARFGYLPLWTVNTGWITAPGHAPIIAATLMPREGAGDAFLARRWTSLLERAGSPFLLPVALVDGAEEAHRQSDALIAASRLAPRD